MANTRSAKQSIKVNERNRLRNVAVRSRMKTFVKKAELALASGDAEQQAVAVRAAIAEIDKAASKGVIHANSAGRKKASLQRAAKSIG